MSPRRRVSASPRLHVTVVSAKRRTLASEHFRLSYPAGIREREVNQVLNLLESARSDLIRRASMAVAVQFPALELFINDTTGNFVGRTGQPWWAAAAMKGNGIELQPLPLLRRRGVLETTLRHELAHVLIDTVSHGRAPRWLAEGFALYLSGEGPMISRYSPGTHMSLDEIERRLSQPVSPDQMRAAYAAAHGEVRKIIQRDGEAAVWKALQ